MQCSVADYRRTNRSLDEVLTGEFGTGRGILILSSNEMDVRSRPRWIIG